MKRFYPLSVDRLEDRCVPSAVTDLETVAATQVVVADTSTDPTTEIVVVGTSTDSTQFVIDVYPIDPNGVPDPAKPLDLSTNPDVGWSAPTEPVPPVDDPFWY